MGLFWFLSGCFVVYAVESFPLKVFVEGNIVPRKVDSLGQIPFGCVVTIFNSSNKYRKINKVQLDCKSSKHILTLSPSKSLEDDFEISPHSFLTLNWDESQDCFPTLGEMKIIFSPRILVYLPFRFDPRRNVRSNHRVIFGSSKSVNLLLED